MVFNTSAMSSVIIFVVLSHCMSFSKSATCSELPETQFDCEQTLLPGQYPLMLCIRPMYIYIYSMFCSYYWSESPFLNALIYNLNNIKIECVIVVKMPKWTLFITLLQLLYKPGVYFDVSPYHVIQWTYYYKIMIYMYCVYMYIYYMCYIYSMLTRPNYKMQDLNFVSEDVRQVLYLTTGCYIWYINLWFTLMFHCIGIYNYMYIYNIYNYI